MRKLNLRTKVVVSLAMLSLRPAWGQVSVLTQHNDNGRTGANLNETILKTSNVNVTQFGKLFSRAVNGQIYAQPLYVPNVNVPGQGLRNVVYVATETNNVYAFDADNPSASTPYWQVNLGPSVPDQDTGCTDDLQPVVGITSTPVIDLSNKTIYVVAMTKQSNSYFQKLHALDVGTGQQRPGSPANIQATILGTGDGSSNGSLRFDPLRQLNRPGLLLLNGLVYLAFGSHCDVFPYHGWVFAYNALTLQQVAVWNTTPDNGMSGIWQSGQGLVSDANGFIYFMTGNGSFNANAGGSAYGESFVKLSTPGLNLTDYFTPNNFDSLNIGDLNLGSAGPLLIPGANRLVSGGKEGVLYVLDTNSLGSFNAANDQVLQRFQVTNGPVNNPIHGSPVYWNSPGYGPLIYVWGDTDTLKAFRYVSGPFQTTPVMTGTFSQGSATGPHVVFGGMLSLSANGSTPGTGIIWSPRSNAGDANPNTQPGILHAFDASNLSVELWNSRQNAARDDFGNFAKLVPPTIANGKVYLATFSNRLVVYGLNGAPPPPDTTPPVVSNGQPSGNLASGTTQTTLSVSTNENATCRYAKTANTAYASMTNVFSTTGGLAHSTLVTGLANGQSYNYYVRCSDASNNINTSDYPISFTVGTVPPISGLVAAYAFNENTGSSTADTSGNGNPGILNGASWTTQGKYSNALSFNGSSYVTVNDSNSLDLTTGMTLEAWVYPTVTSTNWSTAMMKEQPGELVYTLYAGSPANRPNVYISNPGEQGLAGPSALALNTWSHLTATYDGAILRLYVNGNQVASRAVTGSIVSSTGALRIGGNAVWGEYFQGRIDEVRLYNRALTQTEIQSDMNTPIGGTPPPDTTPPAISNGQPTGTLPAGTTQATLSVSTNENATCRYASTAGTPYASMSNTFTNTGTLAHATLVTGLTNGQSYNYYIRCSDGSGNANTGDYPISFTVAALPPPDTTPPVVSNGQPSGNLASGTTQTTLSVSTNENATCRYAKTANTAYASMTNVFSTTGGLAHSTLVTGLANGQSYNYYVRCSDASNNINTSDYPISFTVGTVPPISGLVAAYAFNENTGSSTADTSGNGNPGILNGASWTTQGKYSNALSFNGSSYVTVNDSNSLDLTTGMTLEAWVYPTVTSTNWSTAMMKEQPGELVYTLYAGSPANRPNVYISNPGEQGLAGPSALALNTWSHLTATYDGAILRLYVNGNQVASRAVTGSIVSSTGALRIGGNAVWGEYFQGRIDEVRLYNRALTQTEIQSDMNTPVQ